MQKFQKIFAFEKRLDMAKKIREKYPNYIPIIVEISERSTLFKLSKFDNQKFLIASDITIGQLIYMIRKKLDISTNTAIFLFVDNILPPVSQLLSKVDQEHKSDDLLLYFIVSDESVFG